MLERAERDVPEASFRPADLRALPFADQEYDLVVCGLALAHLAELNRTIGELTRVLRPGGRLVVSVLHPFLAHLGWHAPFADAEGRRRFVREHPHTHAEYFAAFDSAGSQVVGCLEPRMTDDLVQTKERAFRHAPSATVQAYAGLPAVLVWNAERLGRRGAASGAVR